MADPARAGVVLAGGFSTRFGDRDKALARVGGDPMLARVVTRLSRAVDRVVVSCRPDQRDSFDAALDAGDDLRFALDPEPDRGPLAGIRSSFEGIETDYAAVVACDMPWLDPGFLDALFERARGRDAAVPELGGDRCQPAQAVYRTDAALSVARERLAADRRSLRGALDDLDAVVVPAETVANLTTLRSLRDVNTRAELDAYEGNN